MSIRAVAAKGHSSPQRINEAELARKIPTLEVTTAYIRGVGGSDQDITLWQERCRRLRSQTANPASQAAPSEETTNQRPPSTAQPIQAVPDAVPATSQQHSASEEKLGRGEEPDHVGNGRDSAPPAFRHTTSAATGGVLHSLGSQKKRRIAAILAAGAVVMAGTWTAVAAQRPDDRLISKAEPTPQPTSAGRLSPTSSLTFSTPTSSATPTQTMTSASPTQTSTSPTTTEPSIPPRITTPTPQPTQTPAPSTTTEPPIPPRTTTSTPEPPRPQCPGEACEGQSPFNAADCSTGHTLVTPVVDIKVSDGTPIATLTVAASEKCNTRWAKVTMADGAERRIIVELVTNDGRTITTDEVDDFSYTTMLLARPGLCFIGRAHVYPGKGGPAWVAQTESTC